MNNFAFAQESLARCREFAMSGRVVVFDTETTGLSNCDQIVQIAAVEYVGGKKTRAFSTYVCPTCPIDPNAEAVHGLSREFLETNGVSPCEAVESFFNFLGRDVLLIGHNIHFDLRMLQNECRIFHVDTEVGGISFCDTIKLAKSVGLKSLNYRLETLVDVLGLRDECNSHDALDDTNACGAVFLELISRIATEHTVLSNSCI